MRVEAGETMQGFVYVLFSEKDKRTYVGSTDNLRRRIAQHNAGLVKSTKFRRPLKLVYFENYIDLSEARMKEKYYKCCSCRKKLAIILTSLLPPW